MRPFLGLLVLIADQLTKAWVREQFALGESRPLIDGIFHLTYVQNTGAAFGLFQGQTLLIVIVTSLIALLAFRYRNEFKHMSPPLRTAYALGIAGAAGNFIDRIRFGWVTDFLDLRVWPIFNVADVAIVVAVALVIWHGVIRPTPHASGKEA